MMPMHIKIDVNAQGRLFAKTRHSTGDGGEYRDSPVVWADSVSGIFTKLAKWAKSQTTKQQAKHIEIPKKETA